MSDFLRNPQFNNFLFIGCTCLKCHDEKQRLVLERMQIENNYLREKMRIDIATRQLEVKVLKYGSDEKGSSLCRLSILLGFIMSKNLRGLWFYLLIKVQNATSLFFWHKKTQEDRAVNCEEPISSDPHFNKLAKDVHVTVYNFLKGFANILTPMQKWRLTHKISNQNSTKAILLFWFDFLWISLYQIRVLQALSSCRQNFFKVHAKKHKQALW